MKIKVTFIYDPEEPDPDHPTGLSEDEYTRIVDGVMSIGGYDVEIDREGP